MSEQKATFGTSINCMDGRAIRAAHDWMRENFQTEFIDTLTEPGMDHWLITDRSESEIAHIQKKLEISVGHHGSRVLSVCGHEDCAGNPVSKEEHFEDIKKSVALVSDLAKRSFPSESLTIVGLYARPDNGVWIIEKVC